MTFATSLVLLTLGVLLAFTVDSDLAGISSRAAGAMFVLAGSVALTISAVALAGRVEWGVMPRRW